MKKKMIYLAATLIFAFYLFCLHRATALNVPDLYRMFYVDHTLKYYTNEDMLKNYVCDTQYIYAPEGQYYNQGVGWDVTDEKGSWAVGEESSVYFYLENIDANQYVFSMELAVDPEYTRSLYVNDTYVSNLPIGQDILTWDIDVPKEYLQTGNNEFSIRTEEDVLPQSVYFDFSDDDREVNFIATSVMLRTR